jgi:hypothetical protein
MEAKELRIGNYIDLGGLRNFHIVDELHQITSLNINPIPITEEWLLKFGFDLSDEDLFINRIKDNDDFFYDLWTRTERGLVIFGDIMNKKTDETNSFKFEHIKHVHQLQNLYFALTGEELSCN